MENVGRRKLWRIHYLDYLGEKTLTNSLFQINTGIKDSVKLREKTWQLAIDPPMFSPANIFRYTVTDF